MTDHAQRPKNLTMDVSFVWSNTAVLIKVASWKYKRMRRKRTWKRNRTRKGLVKCKEKNMVSKDNKHWQQPSQGNLVPLDLLWHHIWVEDQTWTHTHTHISLQRSAGERPAEDRLWQETGQGGAGMPGIQGSPHFEQKNDCCYSETVCALLKK